MEDQLYINPETYNRVRGSLLGGAMGDALGYPVEFQTSSMIKSEYGPEGITSYQLDRATGKALISDDTQMTLFTADGILLGETRGASRGIMAAPHVYVWHSYLDWYRTQTESFHGNRFGGPGLMNTPELFHKRAPGGTCLTALSNGNPGSVKDKINDSKGCGGIMRVAPLALYYRPGDTYFRPLCNLDYEGAEIAALTHSHPLGYMPAAVLTHIIARCVTESPDVSLEKIIRDARDTVANLFKGKPYVKDMTELINKAIRLAKNDLPDTENICALGGGWVAEETLAIAVYCALRHEDDFSAALIAAVNHDGDSDSTGAVVGQILGARIGYDAIPEKWKDDLELRDTLLDMADKLTVGVRCIGTDEYGYPIYSGRY